MQRIPKIEEGMSIDEKFRLLYDWCFILSQELDKEETESLALRGGDE